VEIPELQRLKEASAALEDVRRRSKGRRRFADLEAAGKAVQIAATAAHDAGIGWVEIGDVLGIVRATPRAEVTRLSDHRRAPDPRRPHIGVVLTTGSAELNDATPQEA
jgi:hypothetical protein